MFLCSDLSQASVEDLIPELRVAAQPNLRGLLLVLQDGLRRPCQSAGTAQLAEWKNKRNLRYKSNLSWQDIYKSSELWSPLLRACLCPRVISIQQRGGGERQSSDFSQFLCLIFFLSYQEEKKDLRNWEHLASQRSMSPAELRAHQARQNANKPYEMLPAATGLQHKEVKGQKGKQRQSKMMGFALVCP